MRPALAFLAAVAASVTQCGAADPPGWVAPFGLAAGQTFVGHYTCGSTAWLFLTIESATSERVDAAFHFLYPGSTQNGAFELRGSFMQGRVLKLVCARIAAQHRLRASG